MIAESMLRKIQGALSESDPARRLALDTYKTSGATLDEFPRTHRSVEAMAHALTRAEDFLELERGSRADKTRALIRPLRRDLEEVLA